MLRGPFTYKCDISSNSIHTARCKIQLRPLCCEVGSVFASRLVNIPVRYASFFLALIEEIAISLRGKIHRSVMPGINGVSGHQFLMFLSTWFQSQGKEGLSSQLSILWLEVVAHSSYSGVKNPDLKFGHFPALYSLAPIPLALHPETSE